MNQSNASPSENRMPASRPARTRRWLSVVLGVVIFLSGVVVGGAGAFIVLREVTLYRLHNPEKRILQDTKVLQRKLGLTEEQTRDVLAIFSRYLKKFQQFRRETRPGLDAKIESLKAEVAAVLQEEQAQKWNAWIDDTRKTWMPPITPPEDETEE